MQQGSFCLQLLNSKAGTTASSTLEKDELIGTDSYRIVVTALEAFLSLANFIKQNKAISKIRNKRPAKIPTIVLTLIVPEVVVVFCSQLTSIVLVALEDKDKILI